MPPNFMVMSQLPSNFLRTSCSGPGLGNSCARTAGVARATTRAAAQKQRTAFIGTLHGLGDWFGNTVPPSILPTAPAGVDFGERWNKWNRVQIGCEGLYFAGGTGGSSVVSRNSRSEELVQIG